MKTISDSGIAKLHSNGGRSQTIILSNEKSEKFRIAIKSESFEFQSYAVLSKWTDNAGWAQIVKKNPVRDYNIDISYNSTYKPTTFLPIINDLKKIAKSF